MLNLKRALTGVFALMISFAIVQGPALASDQGNDGWELAKDENGIQVWMKQEEGKKFESYRVKTVIEATPALVEAVVSNVEEMPNWWKKAKATKALEMISDREYVVYLVYDMPWPMKDRDFVQHAKGVEQEDGSIVVTIDNASDRYPEQKKYVRVKESYQIWKMKPLEGGKLELTLQGNADVGDVPVGMANSMLPAEQYEMMASMVGAVEASK